MKKPLRFLLIVLGSVAALVALALVLAFTPGVQTWAAKRFAPATLELAVDIGAVNAGLKSTRLENIRVVQPGLVLTVPLVEVDVGVIAAAGGNVSVGRLVAKGWTLDLSGSAASASASSGTPASTVSDPSRALPVGKSHNDSTFAVIADDTSAAFDGIFKLLDLPVDLEVTGVDLAGEIILPDGRGQLTLSGGGVGATRTGKFNAVFKLRKNDGTEFESTAELSARMPTSRTFDLVGFEAVSSFRAVNTPLVGNIRTAVQVSKDAKGEAYAFSVRTGDKVLVQADVALPPGAADLSGSWQIDATAADVAPFAMGKPVPEFAAKGQGTFSSDRTFKKISAAGSLDASVEKLASIDPALGALGRLTLAAAFDVDLQGEDVRLDKLDVRVAGDRPVASVVALQSVRFNPSTGALSAANPAAELLRVTLDGLPLAWAGPFLGDLAIAGDDVRGSFTVTARDGGFALRPAAPLVLGNLSVSQAGKPLVSALDVSLSAQANYAPSGFTAEVTDLSVRGAGTPLAKFTLKATRSSGDKQPLAAVGSYEVNLPAVLAQPVAAGSASLQRGVARGDFTASVAEAKTASLTLQLAELLTAEGTVLPAVALQARADIDASGRVNAQIPVVITHVARRSDITLGAQVSTAAGATDIKARLSSDALHIPDLQLFAALAPAKPVVAPATAASAPAKSAPSASKPSEAAPAVAPAPLWAGVTGELTLALKRVVYATDVEVTGIEGAVKITPDALTLENLVAALKTGGRLKAGGGLLFDAKQPQPYGLKADVSMTDVEPAPILRALSPRKPSPVEGKFDLATQLSGRATEPAGFTDSVVGDIKLTSKGGTLKALDVKTGKTVDNVGKTATAVLGIIGAATGNESATKYADRSRAATDIARQLGAIKFDELNLLLGRDEKNNLGIKDLTLISPLIRLVGSGTITYQPGVPLLQQPLLMTLQLGAKDKFAADLRTLKLLGEKTDATGYSFLAEDLKLDGSLQAIGTKQITDLLTRALTN